MIRAWFVTPEKGAPMVLLDPERANQLAVAHRGTVTELAPRRGPLSADERARLLTVWRDRDGSADDLVSIVQGLFLKN